MGMMQAILPSKRTRPLGLRLRPQGQTPTASSSTASRSPQATPNVILGINLRNALIAKYNPRKAIERARDKVAAKVALNARGIATSGTVAVISNYGELMSFDPASLLPDSWAIKPARGSQGDGIMLAVRRDGADWFKGSGTRLTPDEISNHVRRIVDGQFSGDAASDDAALIEPLIRPDPRLAALVPDGLPDLRLICLGEEPIMAMCRLPTNESDGKANLHQRAIGAAVDLQSGIIYRALQGDEVITHHPDTGTKLIGFQLPEWDKVLDIAARSGPAIGLGYCGVDIVHDVHEGPMVIEVNSHPGLQIQNITLRGLREAMVTLGETF